MATLTLKNIPDDLYDQLKRVAALQRRSINSQIIVCIEQAVRSRRRSTPEMLSQIRALRQSVPGSPFNLDEIDQAKRQGRP